MRKDRFDILTAIGFCVVLAFALLLFINGDPSGLVQGKSASLMAEKLIQERAQAAFLAETYVPVEQLIAEDRLGEALMRLEQIERDIPGEAHTALLRGGLLVRQGALVEGVAEYVRAVKARADYIDRRSPLQRRDEFELLLQSALPVLQQRLQQGAKSPSLDRAIRDLRYLQSRLAGGCE